MEYPSPDMAVMGIDAGGTRTVALLTDERGNVLSEARGDGANLQSVGSIEVERVLRDVIGRATQEGSPAVVCLGMAGVDRPNDEAIVRAILERILPGVNIIVVNDALIALEAGAPASAGTVVIAGTGSIAYGRTADGRAARAGGWGYVLGDEGSGYWIGRLALRAVVRASDGRGPATAMADPVLRHFGVGRPQDLVREIYLGAARPTAIAGLAPLVGAAAADGDPTALHIVTNAAEELAGATVSVVTRLRIERAPIVLSGGALLGLDLLRTGLELELSERLPEAPVRHLVDGPAQGAVRLAIAAVDGALVLPAYDDGYS